jgi:hypothetical protein
MNDLFIQDATQSQRDLKKVKIDYDGRRLNMLKNMKNNNPTKEEEELFKAMTEFSEALKTAGNMLFNFCDEVINDEIFKHENKVKKVKIDYDGRRLNMLKNMKNYNPTKEEEELFKAMTEFSEALKTAGNMLFNFCDEVIDDEIFKHENKVKKVEREIRRSERLKKKYKK